MTSIPLTIDFQSLRISIVYKSKPEKNEFSIAMILGSMKEITS